MKITKEWIKQRIKLLDREIDEIYITAGSLPCWPNEGLDLRYTERMYWAQRLKELK